MSDEPAAGPFLAPLALGAALAAAWWLAAYLGARLERQLIKRQLSVLSADDLDQVQDVEVRDGSCA